MRSEREDDIIVLRSFINRWSREEAIEKKARGIEKKYVERNKGKTWVKWTA